MAGSKYGQTSMKINGPPPVCTSKTAEQLPSESNHGVLGSIVAVLPAAAFSDGIARTMSIIATGAVNAQHVEGTAIASDGTIVTGTVDWVTSAGVAEVAMIAERGGAIVAAWETGDLQWNQAWPMRYNGVTAQDVLTGTSIAVMSSVS